MTEAFMAYDIDGDGETEAVSISPDSASVELLWQTDPVVQATDVSLTSDRGSVNGEPCDEAGEHVALTNASRAETQDADPAHNALARSRLAKELVVDAADGAHCNDVQDQAALNEGVAPNALGEADGGRAEAPDGAWMVSAVDDIVAGTSDSLAGVEAVIVPTVVGHFGATDDGMHAPTVVHGVATTDNVETAHAVIDDDVAADAAAGIEPVRSDGHAEDRETVPAGDAGGASFPMRETVSCDADTSDRTNEQHVPSSTSCTDELATNMVGAQTQPSTPRRNRRRSQEDRTDEPAVPHLPAVAEPAHAVGTLPADAHITAKMAAAANVTQSPAHTDEDGAWRDDWPENEVQIVGRLLPGATDAPMMDGVLRVRMELALVEQYDGEFGSIGNLPLFILPDAPGFGPIYRDLMRAYRYNPHAEPIMVELRGILRQLTDRDPRYATPRFSVLMGVEVHRVRRAERHAEQYAFWRGRATVRNVHTYSYQGQPYQRVTAVVTHKQHKPRLRGLSVMHIPVDFLVAQEHEHADRFGRIGQPLLIEANIASDVFRMKDTHPLLEGLAPERKAQLQVLREPLVSVTMGEFPDAVAEHVYTRWVRSGRPRPQRPVHRSSSVVRANDAPAVQSADVRSTSTDMSDAYSGGQNQPAARKDTSSNRQRAASLDSSSDVARTVDTKQPRATKAAKPVSRVVGDRTG